jgi:transcriptional regulator with XRE-family HTH domain
MTGGPDRHEDRNMGTQNQLRTATERGPLGEYLWDLRQAAQMTLREVEEAAEGRVSNAYISQLETGKIAQPSPSILHCLAEVYAARLPKSSRTICSFEKMMELAGHISCDPKQPRKKTGRLPTFAEEELTAEEEEELLKYLAFIRMRRGKKHEEG